MYYRDSNDFILIEEVLEEIDFLRRTGLLSERGLGKLEDIIRGRI